MFKYFAPLREDAFRKRKGARHKNKFAPLRMGRSTVGQTLLIQTLTLGQVRANLPSGYFHCRRLSRGANHKTKQNKNVRAGNLSFPHWAGGHTVWRPPKNKAKHYLSQNRMITSNAEVLLRYYFGSPRGGVQLNPDTTAKWSLKDYTQLAFWAMLDALSRGSHDNHPKKTKHFDAVLAPQGITGRQ